MKDLRKDFDYSDDHLKIPKGHLDRFETRLGATDKKLNYTKWILRIASVLVIGLLATSYWFHSDSDVEMSNSVADQTVDLNQISPELGDLEAFFKASINYELATLDYGNYEDVAFSYLEELEKIEKDYVLLQKDLQASGFNETIIESMIENLQLRLELLQNLKLKLNELKTLTHEKNKSQKL